MFDELMLPDRARLSRSVDGDQRLLLPLRLPWYRQLPLSCIKQVSLTIDEDRIDPGDIRVSVGDGFHTLDEAKALDMTWWFQLDTAKFAVHDRIGLTGGTHKVGLVLALQIPYGSGPEGFPDFRQSAECVRSVQFIEGGE